jgi:hypothetical protein
MTAMLRRHSIRPQERGPAFGNGIQPVGVLPLVRRLVSKGDVA